jgi:hypothetical protein
MVVSSSGTWSARSSPVSLRSSIRKLSRLHDMLLLAFCDLLTNTTRRLIHCPSARPPARPLPNAAPHSP